MPRRTTRKRKSQRGGHPAEYSAAWRNYIERGVLPQFTLFQLRTIDLSSINPDNVPPEAAAHDPPRTFTAFVDALITPTPPSPGNASPLARQGLIAFNHALVLPFHDRVAAIQAIPPAQLEAARNWKREMDNTWRTVVLPSHGDIPDPVMQLIGERCAHITKLVCHNPTLTDNHLFTLYWAGPSNIDKMDFSGCTGLTYNAMEFPRVYVPIELNLSDIPTLTDEWVESALAPDLEGVDGEPDGATPQTLTLDNLPGLTNVGAHHVTVVAPRYLRHLSIRNNPNIDDTFLQTFAMTLNPGNSFLQSLNLSGCPHIVAFLAANPGINFFGHIGLEQIHGQPIWRVPPPPGAYRHHRGA